MPIEDNAAHREEVKAYHDLTSSKNYISVRIVKTTRKTDEPQALTSQADATTSTATNAASTVQGGTTTP